MPIIWNKPQIQPGMSELINNLSVIIVTYHGDGLLKDCLDSIHNVFGDKIEIIVVDNANQSSTCKLCSAYNRVKYIAAPENLGFAGGNNIGLKATSKDYILLLNNDTVIHEDSFSPLLDFLANNQKVGIVQGTMNIPSANVLDDCGVMMTPFGIQRHLERGKPTASTPLSPRKVFAAKGAMLMFKRKVLADTSFLFYDHFKSYYEETDFCHRARLKGWQTWFVPTPPIDHLGGQTVGKIPSQEVWSQYFANIIYSFRKNFGFWGHIFTLPCFIIAAFLHSPKNLIKALRILYANSRNNPCFSL